YFQQRFAEPGWNLRRILGYPGQRAPGAGLIQLDFELLYGISGTIKNNPELRFAEIGARLGNLTGRVREQPTWPATHLQKAIQTTFITRCGALRQPMMRSSLPFICLR